MKQLKGCVQTGMGVESMADEYNASIHNDGF
jgi:hypothetical protein